MADDAAEQGGTTEIWFYHLERQRLEAVLPNLLEKTRQRGWRAVVQAGGAERLEVIDDALWTYSEQSFLAHGTLKDGPGEAHPVFLTVGDENPNGAHVRFLVDGAEAGDLSGYDRAIYLFNGQDEAAVGRARAAWTAHKADGHAVTYWQQTPRGGWEKKA